MSVQADNSVVCDFDAVNQRQLCCWPSQTPSGSMCGSTCTLAWKPCSCPMTTWQRSLKALGPRPACASCSNSTREPVLLLPAADHVVFSFRSLFHAKNNGLCCYVIVGYLVLKRVPTAIACAGQVARCLQVQSHSSGTVEAQAHRPL